MTLPSEVLLASVNFAGANTGTALTLDDSSRGKLDTGTLSSGDIGDPVFTDITQWVRSGTIQRGSNRVDEPILRYETGTANLTLDNRDRRFDPEYLSGPYVSGGETQVKARRVIRVQAAYGGTTYDLFRGYADNWNVQYPDPSSNDSITVVSASDAFKILSKNIRTAVAPVGASENTGARISRILDSANWPAVDRVISTGNSTVQATTLDGNVLEELQLTAESELGELYIDESGRVFFRNRNGVISETRSGTSQATFDDDLSSGNHAYHGLGLSNDDATLINQVRIQNVGGTVQTAEDTLSQAENFISSYERTDLLLETDQEAANLANWLLYQNKDSEQRFTAITIDPMYNPTDLFPQVLGRRIGDRITVIRRPPGGGTITKEVIIRGIEHSFTPSSWETTFTLQSAVKGSFLVLDNTSLGTLDSNALAY